MDDIRKEEAKNHVVISDRSFYSSLAYQNGEKWIRDINNYVLKPDIVILLDVEIVTALARCEGLDRFEEKAFLDKVRKRYLKLSDKHGFMVVNANNGVNKVHDDIKRLVAPKIGMCIWNNLLINRF